MFSHERACATHIVARSRCSEYLTLTRIGVDGQTAVSHTGFLMCLYKMRKSLRCCLTIGDEIQVFSSVDG